MLQAYPVILVEDENRTVIAQFPDVPEAVTVGADAASALDWAQDALVVALSGYMDARRDIPTPSRRRSGHRSVSLPPMAAMKMAVYQAMRDQAITQAQLGERMRVDSRQVRRILDINHNTRLDHLVAALKVLGRELTIEIKNAA